MNDKKKRYFSSELMINFGKLIKIKIFPSFEIINNNNFNIRYKKKLEKFYR